MTAENTNTTNDSSKNENGVIGTIIELGAATTKMTIDQVQNCFTALTNPGAAIDHVKDTLHALSEAMNQTSGGSGRSSGSTEQAENDLRGAPTGQEHVGTASASDSSTMYGSSGHRSGYSTGQDWGVGSSHHSGHTSGSGHSSSSSTQSRSSTGRSTPRTINRRKS